MTGQPTSDYRYWAFISYSGKDAAHARWLHRAIETYGIPAKLVEHGHTTPAGEPPPKRFQPVFRDRAELPASADLGQTIGDALAASRFLIVICSPNAAHSRWVDREIEAFTGLGRGDRIFAFVVDGEPNSGDERECFPPALRPQEPLAADARRQGDGRDNAKLKLLAGMLGVGFDTLKQREAQRRVRRLQLAIGTVLLLALAFGALAWYANLARQRAVVAEATAVSESHVRATAEANAVNESHVRATAEANAVDEAHARATAQAVAEEQKQEAIQQRNEAERQARLALSGQLASESRVYLGSSPDLALLFATKALGIYDTFQARSALLSSLLQSPHLDRILKTSENVTALAFSPDGKTLAAAACAVRNTSQACTESSVQFWEPLTGRPVDRPFLRLAGLIRALVYAPDGKSLFVGATGGVVREWDTTNQHFAEQYTLNETAVTSLAITPDGRYLAAGNCHSLSMPGGLCTGGSLAVWDLSSAEVVSTTLEGRAPGNRGIAFSPDGHWLVAADCARVEQDNQKVDRCVQGEVRRWRLPGGALERYVVPGSASAMLSVAFAPDGKTLFAGEANGSIHPLEAATLQAAGSSFRAQGASVSGLAVSPQLGGLLIADNSSQSPQVWPLNASSAAAVSLAARQDPKYAFTYSLDLSPDGRFFATTVCPGGAGLSYPCPAGSEIQLWDLVLWDPVESFFLHDPAQNLEIALPADSESPVALTQSRGEVRGFVLAAQTPVGSLLYQGDADLLTVRLSPDGRRAATIDCARRDPAAKTPVCTQTEIRTWDVGGWQPLGQPARVNAWALHAIFSPDGERLAVDGPDDTVIVLDAGTGAQVQAIATGIGPGFRELSFAADSSHLAVSGCLPVKGKLLCQYHDVVKVFDVATGREAGKMAGPFDATVTALAMGPAARGNLVALASWSFSKKEWRLWDWEKGMEVGQPVQGDTEGLAFSPDGRLLAAAGCRSTASGSCGQTAITLWDLDQNQVLGAPLLSTRGGEMRQLFFSQEHRLVSNTANELIVWSLAPADWQRRACRIANRSLTAQEWKTYVGDVAFQETCPELP